VQALKVSRFVLVFSAAVLASALGACSAHLDTGGLEQTLKEQVARDTGSTVTSVDCPAVKAETGGTFECTVTESSGSTFTLKVTQTDDQGHVTYEYVDASPPGSPSSSR
jgi:hypothetical protein